MAKNSEHDGPSRGSQTDWADWHVETDSAKLYASYLGPNWATFSPDPYLHGNGLLWRLRRLGFWLTTSLSEELAKGQALPWHVVAFGLGEVVYLGLPREPSFPILSTVAVVLICACIVMGRIGNRHFFLVLLTMIVVGCWAGQWQAINCNGKTLDHERIALLTGIVEGQETVLRKATRITLRVLKMEARGLRADSTPQSVTITLRASAPRLKVGDGIKFLAKLRPLPGPVLPGGYDFARRAFFDGRGASGFALGKIERVTVEPLPWTAQLKAWIADLRHSIALRITDALPGASGAIAAAMIVGEQRGIPDPENDALRASGLSHIISISGLHMTLVASGVFLAVRTLLAALPLVPLILPIKKIAAAAALVAATAYMLLAGDAVAAERSFIMCAIMLLSIILDRPALTMRNIALSAIIVLLRDPSQVVEPSFLMSYLAVTSLVASYDAIKSYRENHHDKEKIKDSGLGAKILRNLWSRSLSAMLSSLIATAATASVIADQFYRISPYGVIANLLVLPAIDLIAMPAAIISCLVMPFGLEFYPLTVMGWAIDYMTGVAFKTADLPGGLGLLGRINPWSNPLAISGLLWLCLWRSRWRLFGVIPILTALVIAPLTDRPDILIAPSAGPVAVRADDGQLKILDAKSSKFTVSNWLAADAAPGTPQDPRSLVTASLDTGWTCDSLGCLFKINRLSSDEPIRVAVVRHALAFEEDCELADIVISRLSAPDWCADTAYVFDQGVLRVSGTVALYLRPGRATAQSAPEDIPGGRITTAEVEQVRSLPSSPRPWNASVLSVSPARPTTSSKTDISHIGRRGNETLERRHTDGATVRGALPKADRSKPTVASPSAQATRDATDNSAVPVADANASPAKPSEPFASSDPADESTLFEPAQ